MRNKISGRTVSLLFHVKYPGLACLFVKEGIAWKQTAGSVHVFSHCTDGCFDACSGFACSGWNDNGMEWNAAQRREMEWRRRGSRYMHAATGNQIQKAWQTRTHRNINKLASDHFNNVRFSAGTATKKRTIVRETNCFLPSGVGRTATGGTLLFFIFSLLFAAI